MNFGKNLLEKYGWKEGKGIGKHADGIVKPIKAKLKFDTAGLGHDRAEEFTDHWWERAFNDAAQNLNVGGTLDKVAFSINDSDAVEITTNGYSSKQFKKSIKNGLGYNNTFLRSRSTMHKENTSGDSDENEDKHPKLSLNRVLTDEELFKACGGRTAHKGARHGLKLSGKLSRIDAQEQQILANSLNTETAQDTFNEWYTVKKNKKHKKQKKKKSNSMMQDEMDETILPNSFETKRIEALVDQRDYIIRSKSKKKKKKQRQMEEKLSNSMKSLQTESPVNHFDMDNMLHGVLDCSKAIKKDKNRKQKNELKKKSKKAKNQDFLSKNRECNIND